MATVFRNLPAPYLSARLQFPAFLLSPGFDKSGQSLFERFTEPPFYAFVLTFQLSDRIAFPRLCLTVVRAGCSNVATFACLQVQ